MAKVSTTAKNNKRKNLSEKYAKKRAELRAILKDPSATDEEKAKSPICISKASKKLGRGQI